MFRWSDADQCRGPMQIRLSHTYVKQTRTETASKVAQVLIWYPSRQETYRQTSNIRRACRRCSIYIFILDWTPGFIGLDKDNCKTRVFGFGAPYIICLTVISISNESPNTTKIFYTCFRFSFFPGPNLFRRCTCSKNVFNRLLWQNTHVIRRLN